VRNPVKIEKNTPAPTRVEITRHPHPPPVSGLKSPTPATRVGNGYPSGDPHAPPSQVAAPESTPAHRQPTADLFSMHETKSQSSVVRIQIHRP
jgi:hypothetical protein